MDNNIDLTEMLEDYKDGDDKLKKDIVFVFKKKLWNSKCKFRKYIKKYSFIVDTNIIHRQDLINLLNEYNSIDYKVNKNIYKSKMNSIDYIKVHINNLYGVKFDNEIYLSKKYYSCLLTPKKEYFKIIKQIRQGQDEDKIDINNIKSRINNALILAEKEKQKSINHKCTLKWVEYKKLINTYIKRIFDNFIPLVEYEDHDNWEIDDVLIDGWNEDNYIISYMCASLTGYIKNYYNKYFNIKRNREYIYCENCGIPIERTNGRKKYCSQCAKEIEKENWVKRKRKQRAKKKDVTK